MFSSEISPATDLRLLRASGVRGALRPSHHVEEAVATARSARALSRSTHRCGLIGKAPKNQKSTSDYCTYNLISQAQSN